MEDAKELFDMACDHVVENFKVLQRKALEKLIDCEDLFVILTVKTTHYLDSNCFDSIFQTY